MILTPVLLIVLMISISECLGQSCLKKLFVEPTQKHLFFIAVAFYAFVCYLLVLSYKYKGMGIVNVIWSGVSVLLMVSVGILFFHEKLEKVDILGIILIIMGLVLVSWDGAHSEGFYDSIVEKYFMF